MAERTASMRGGDEGRTSDAELASLRAQIKRDQDEKDALRADAEAARRDRDDAHRKLTGEVDQRFTAEESNITEALASADVEADRLEQRIAELNEKGEYAEAAKASREMARVEAKRMSLETRKESLQGEKSRAKATAEAAAKAAAARPASAKDPLEGLTQPAKDWIRNHPEWLTDKSYQNRVTSAHYKALADGIQVDSTRYFRFIENEIGEGDDGGGDNRRDQRGDRQGRDRGGRTERDDDSALSDASNLQDAGGGVDIDDEPAVVLDDDDDLYRQSQETVRQAAARAAAARQDNGARRDTRDTRDNDGGRRSRASSAAPPSRGGATPNGRQRSQSNGDGRVRLNALEAEIALASYPPGEHPGIKSKEDAYRAYHSQKMSLDADGRLGTRRT